MQVHISHIPFYLCLTLYCKNGFDRKSKDIIELCISIPNNLPDNRQQIVYSFITIICAVTCNSDEHIGVIGEVIKALRFAFFPRRYSITT